MNCKASTDKEITKNSLPDVNFKYGILRLGDRSSCIGVKCFILNNVNYVDGLCIQFIKFNHCN